MTDAHQDVAGLVASLRQDDEMLRDGHQKNLTKLWHSVVVKDAAKDCAESADRLESLSQALREAEADIAVKETATAASARLAHKLMTRALAAESRLAEAMSFIENRVAIDCYLCDYTLEFQPTSLAKEARAFIAGNGGKDE